MTNDVRQVADEDSWRARYEEEYKVVDRIWAAVKHGAGYPGEELSGIVTDYVTRAEKAEADLAEARREMRQHVQQRITTRCPSCGHQSLFIGSGGHLTCSWLECTSPGLERAIETLKASPPAPSGWQQRIAETKRRAFEAGFLASPGWQLGPRLPDRREWRFTGDADTHPAHDLMSDAWGAWKRLPASQALPESKRSGSDILLHHLDLWANHARGCSADDCPRCEAAFNLVIKAHTVWSNSQNGQHAKDALPPSSSESDEALDDIRYHLKEAWGVLLFDPTIMPVEVAKTAVTVAREQIDLALKLLPRSALPPVSEASRSAES